MALLRLALPKGRLSEEALVFLQQKEILPHTIKLDERKFIISLPEQNIELLVVRARDVAHYVEQQAADIGIVGEDMLLEYDYEVLTALALPFGFCRLSLAYPKDKPNWMAKPTIRVATKYPRLSYRYFFSQGLHVQIIELYGSIEIAPLTGLSDIIVDLVSTGQTLKAHNLIEGDVLLTSSARFIINPTSWVFRSREIGNLLDKLRRK